jgi:hypothetical protein
MRVLLVAVAALILGGCYHATIDTGLQPSGQKIEKKWAHGFVYGLVPPETIETASRCPNGVAKVETRLSFLNQLASALTWGLYTPMTIEVNCAAVGTASIPADAEKLTVAEDASEEEVAQAFDEAARRSSEQRAPVWVSFE